jgi:Protein of unknown function (DUF3768)
VAAVAAAMVAALGGEVVQRIVKTIAVFDDFCHANDPHEEHDFGAFDADGHMIYFKIDYYEHLDALARSSRSHGHPTRHHDHAGGGVLAIVPQAHAESDSKRRIKRATDRVGGSQSLGASMFADSRGCADARPPSGRK